MSVCLSCPGMTGRTPPGLSEETSGQASVLFSSQFDSQRICITAEGQRFEYKENILCCLVVGFFFFFFLAFCKERDLCTTAQ